MKRGRPFGADSGQAFEPTTNRAEAHSPLSVLD